MTTILDAEDGDLIDLDTLLAESTALAGAQRAKATGRKLTTEQCELLEANSLAEQMTSWREVEAIAHFVESECACGKRHRRFVAWYKVLEHRKQPAMKLVRGGGADGLPAKQYVTRESVGCCAECLGQEALPMASPERFTVLAGLGTIAQVCDRQAVLPFPEVSHG